MTGVVFTEGNCCGEGAIDGAGYGQGFSGTETGGFATGSATPWHGSSGAETEGSATAGVLTAGTGCGEGATDGAGS